MSAASSRLIDDERQQGESLPDMQHLAIELAGLFGRETTPLLLDSGQAVEILNVPKSWIAAEARAGRIPHVRLGRYVRFNRDELMRWCEGRSVGPRPRRGRGTSLLPHIAPIRPPNWRFRYPRDLARTQCGRARGDGALRSGTMAGGRKPQLRGDHQALEEHPSRRVRPADAVPHYRIDLELLYSPSQTTTMRGTHEHQVTA